MKKINYYFKIANKILSLQIFKIKSFFYYLIIKNGLIKSNFNKINIGSGTLLLPDYCNLDIFGGADLYLDLEKKLLPFPDCSIDVAVCISAINYFTKKRGEKIIKDVYRVLKPGGIARFGTQDFHLIAEKYLNNDRNFFFQKLPNGQDRFVGETACDKINSWFYGYAVSRGRGCKYFFDYETLSLLFKKAGFSVVEQRSFGDSRVAGVINIDNRQDQMFFLEAIK